MLSAPEELIIDLREGSVSGCRPDLDAKRETVYMWIADKQMPVHEVGMPWKFVVSEIDAWVQTGNAGRKYALNRWRPDGLAAEGAMRQ
jgi:excisionase family DNA binding protein